MVKFDLITKVYGDGTTAVENFTLEVEKGECVVLIGPSGCGKTTTLKMVNRLEEPSSGTIRIDGRDISGVNPVMLRRNIGYVIQDTGLMPHLTVAENIAMVLHLHKWSARKIDARVDELLKLANLDPGVFKYRLPSDMSGGQRQRIGVLRGLAAEPDVVLMDEPFGALDPITRELLQGELLSLQENLHKTIIFVTHDIDEALKLGDRIVLMRGGKIEQVGTPEQLKSSPKNDFVKNFIGEDRLSNVSPETPVEELVEAAPLTILPSLSAGEALDRLEKEGRDTAQVVDSRGTWRGMLRLNRVKQIAGLGGTAADAARFDRKLTTEEATIRDAAEMLADRDMPIPILDRDGKLKGVITSAGIARLTIHRLTRNDRLTGGAGGKQVTGERQGVRPA